MMKKLTLVSLALAAMMAVPVMADDVTIQLGFENSASEPVGQALQKWADLIDEKGDGSLKLELYPDSQLGSKSELIDGMTFPVIIHPESYVYSLALSVLFAVIVNFFMRRQISRINMAESLKAVE